ncbi:uncharacterized protein GGS22DRAFT_163157 [Annulohypoxylon maeteangense]|uniref:uncharacterized protein n=1 Tax=Annulohypoxylon maeteangense TaxID=1927788 RepID=UPI0020072C7E|nr:uncharacterized protein GGS22DRAFT_163157 [Annulohypoxylon maeteangense]KAI0885226.1 hypothetical protein GGS22DRAFT_163157 [Annulohypoxylon maeteangense]
MATKQEFSAPRKKGLMTYGKAARKRQPKTVFTPAAFPPILEDDDGSPVTKHKATVTHRRPSLLTSPQRDPSSPSSSLDNIHRNKTNTINSNEDLQSQDRKRKISQVYTSSKGRVQEPAQTGQKSVSQNRIPPRSRPSTSTSLRTSKPIASTSRQRARPVSPELMDIDNAEPSLSSPPPTPTLPKPSRQPKAIASKGLTSSVSGTKAAGKAKQGNTQHQIPLRFAREDITKPAVPRASSSVSSKIVNKEVRPTPQLAPESVSKKRRRRLIDTLIEQTKDDEDEEVMESVDEVLSSQVDSSQPTLSHQVSDVSMLESQPLPQTPSRNTTTSQATSIRTFARSSSALKFTYGQGRKVLEEEGDLLESLILPEESSTSLKGRRLELGTPKKVVAAKGALDDDDLGINGSPNSKLRDIHELRQAGANSRVADTMQDLADQIGSPCNKPSSSRRAALIQVAEKIKDKAFMWQCRDHGVEAALLKDTGKESDIISGYLILSILVTILAKWPSSHIQQLVRLGNPAGMFSHLLGISKDIKVIARDRKSNLSKRSQASLIAIQTSLRELSIWDKASPSYISPRSLVLKCLHLLVAHDVNAARDPAIFSPAVTGALFSVLSEAAENAEHWNYPEATEAIDLAHALSILEFYAVSIAETQRIGVSWVVPYLPIVADVFGASSQNIVPDVTAQNSEGKLLEDAVLKLTINLTNNSLEAPEIFVSKGLIPALAGSISSNFTKIWDSLSQDTWVDGLLDSLVLRLGILINFSEHSSLVREVINDCHHDGQRPIDELIRLFLENYRRTAEADSMETSHLNVAFGYLTVLLGYLALHGPVRQKIRSSHSAKSIKPLLDSLREFLTHHRKVEQSVEESEDGSRGHSSYTERLQDLVHQLEDQAAYD